MHSPISVLVVDDSAFMRKVISEMLSEEDGIVVVGQARDGIDAIDKVQRLRPDVVTMDVEMPGQDGVAALEEIMRKCPTAVLMLSSQTSAGADVTIRCLELGAVDFVAKPSGAISLDIRDVSRELTLKVKSAARFGRMTFSSPRAEPPPAQQRKRSSASTQIVIIGASTGGPAALQVLIPSLPGDLRVPVVIVQHMPPMFTTSLAQRLDANSALTVREAQDGDRLRRGTVLLAPGGRHLTFDAGGTARMTDEPPVHGVRPAVDLTIASLARHYRDGVLAVLLTGMGRDGALGLRAVSRLGGGTIAQDESSCVVYGMPRAAVELGVVDLVLPLKEIGPAIVNAVGRSSREAA